MHRSSKQALLTLISFFTVSVALPSSSWSAVVTVGCPGGIEGDYTSITAALTALDRSASHTIQVSGSCAERVSIFDRERITIVGIPPLAEIVSPDLRLDVVAINQSRNIVFRQLTIRGGDLGLNVNSNAEVEVWNSTIRNNNVGVETSGPRASVRLYATSIQDNGFGLFVTEGTYAQLFPIIPEPVRISNNTNIGIIVKGGTLYALGLVVENNGNGLVFDGGRFSLQGGPGYENFIRGNRNDGMQITNGASATISGSLQASNNGGSGIAVSGASAQFNGGLTAENNGGWGVLATSHAQLSLFGRHLIRNNSDPKLARGGVTATRSTLTILGNTEITGNYGPGVRADFNSNIILTGVAITNNTGDGVRLHRRAVGVFGPPLTIENNGGASISCSPSALISGDFSGVPDVQCTNVEAGARSEEEFSIPSVLDIPAAPRVESRVISPGNRVPATK